MNKVEKLFLVPMVMAVAVKIMAMAATIAPVVNATGIARTARGRGNQAEGQCHHQHGYSSQCSVASRPEHLPKTVCLWAPGVYRMAS